MTLDTQHQPRPGTAQLPEVHHWEGDGGQVFPDPPPGPGSALAVQDTAQALAVQDTAGPDTAPAVVLSDVSFRYPGAAADRLSLDGLSFAIPAGTVFGLLGPNGCGKTTAINAITGQIIPGRGTVRVFGMDPDRRGRGHLAVNRVIGVVTQGTALYGKLSVRQNLMFQASLYGYRPRDARYLTDRALDLADLQDRADDPAKTLSGGMARRAAIYRAAMHSPRMLILDEPTVGLDLIQRADLWEHIKMLRAEHGVTVLLTTQYLEEAEALADNVAIMRSGTLAAPVSTPQKLREDYGALVITVRATAPAEPAPAGRGALDRLLETLDAVRDELVTVPGISHVTASTQGSGWQAGEFVLEITASAQGDVDGQVTMLLVRHGITVRGTDKRLPSLDEVVRELAGTNKAAG